jgi:uncharacterized protein (DUF927 family)
LTVQNDNEISNFEDQPLELDTGDWKSDETGVWRQGMGGVEIACTHPIMPVQRLRNIDTGELKIRLQFRRGSQNRKSWSNILIGLDTLANAKNIVNLAQIGVSVTSGKRAQSLVDYLADVMDRNYDIIPETRSVSRMGWNEEGFSPYVDGIVFDGNDNFSRTFKAIGPHGHFKDWLDAVNEVRHYSLAARVVLAASFASALVEPLGVLPFFVHLWGMDSGSGKTTGLMLAASVWGNPAVGGPYLATFKSTAVGTEILAGFLHSLPVILDELQLARDSRGKINFNVYELASGSGKLRSNKALGLAHTPTWANCFITSGETPLVAENDGAGAVNRVIEVECKAEAKVVEDGHKTANTLKEHYGHAGKAFIERLTEDGGIEKAKRFYEAYYAGCLRNDAVEKQAHAAALILTADTLICEWIFKDNYRLEVKDIAEYLKTKEAVSAAERGYAYMCDWVAQNSAKMQGRTDIDVYGRIDGNTAYIIRSVFYTACESAGISAKALLSHLKSKGLIEVRNGSRAVTVGKSLGGSKVECVALKLPADDMQDNELEPF